MMFIVEVSEGREPFAWFAYGEADFARKVAAGDELRPWEIHDVVTPRELLGLGGQSPESPTARATFPAICALGDRHGWDVPLYRADYLLGRGSYQPDAVSVMDAHLAALDRRGGAYHLYPSEDAALGALEDPDEAFLNAHGWRARHALREQLVAMEVVSDNL